MNALLNFFRLWTVILLLNGCENVKTNWRKRIGIIVYIILLLSIIYSVYKIVTTSSQTTTEGVHIRSDYILMLIQCCLGTVVIGLPSVLEKRFSFELPNSMSIAYFVFLYCAIYLGEVRQFYYLIPRWDDILHCFSGAMLGAFGFTLVAILNDSERVRVELNPYFICLFAFCFAMAVGAIWEIYEFMGDSLFGLNMQKFRLEDGTLLIGNNALKDTMHDIIIDAIGALSVSVLGLLNMKIKEKAKNKTANDNKTA